MKVVRKIYIARFNYRFNFSFKGKILIDDIVLDKENSSYWQKKIGYVSQDVFILEDSFINNIAFGVDEDKIDFKSRIRSQKSKNK